MKILMLLIVALCTCTVATAGGLALTQATATPLNVNDTRIDTRIREQVAVTVTTQRFIQPQVTDRIAYGIGIAPGATVTSMRWLVRGVWYKAGMQAADSAMGSGGGGAVGRGHSFLTSLFGTSGFVFDFRDTLLAGDTIIVEVTTMQLLDYTSGSMFYTYPLPPFSILPSIAINEWTIDLSSTYPVVNYRNAFSSAAVVSDTSIVDVMRDVKTTSDLGFAYSLVYDALTMNVLSTKPGKEDGYALMLAVPQATVDPDDVLAKRFTFVLDRSGSMSGIKITQAIEAAQYCVSRLRTKELFNIVPFSTQATPWASAHVQATPENVDSALRYLSVQAASGGTNINGALTTALSMHVDDDYVNVIIFLTDGIAPIDHAALRQANTSQTRIFVFGIGDDVSTAELTKIANDHRGAIEIIHSTSRTSERISALFERIREPLIKDPSVSFAPMVLKDVYPTNIPDIYAGEQLRLIGRYTTPGECLVTVSGSNALGPAAYSFTAHLTADSLINLFLPKLWARERINYVLDLMSREPQSSGRWKEWRDEVIRLGLTYGIPTPFTTLVDSGTPDDKNPTSVFDPREVEMIPVVITPNPALTMTRIQIPEVFASARDLTIVIVDAAGRHIRTLASGMASGITDVTWDLLDDAGRPVPSGAYRVIISCSDGQTSSSIVVTR